MTDEKQFATGELPRVGVDMPLGEDVDWKEAWFQLAAQRNKDVSALLNALDASAPSAIAQNVSRIEHKTTASGDSVPNTAHATSDDKREPLFSDAKLREMWQAAGGRFHGPNIETGTMPEANLLRFLRELVAVSARSSTATRKRLEELYGLVRDGLGQTFPSIDDTSRDCILGYLDELYAATSAPSATAEKHLLDEAGKFFDWGNAASVALKNLLDAYERRIRSLCMPEQIEQKPWECAEFIEARRILDAKPNWFVSTDGGKA